MASNGDLFDNLLHQIVSIKDHCERDKYITKNRQNVIPLFRWLTKTVISLAKQAVLDSSSEEATLHAFCLECILHISSTATSTDDIDSEFCEIVRTNIDFLKYLNHSLYMDYGTTNHIGILVNFTRYIPMVETLCEDIIPEYSSFIAKLISITRDPQCLPEMRTLILNYITNLTHSDKIRNLLIDEQLFSSLLKVFETEKRPGVRKSIVNIFRNCCFDEKNHSKIFSLEDDEFVVKLVYPLAGPEEFDEEDTASLPVDLQYLPLDKERDNDPEFRKLLLEVLLQCCATRYGRETLRKLNIYLILREYHKWEKDPLTNLALENLIDILIKTEDELENIDNLKEVQIPEDIVKKFNKEDSHQ